VVVVSNSISDQESSFTMQKNQTINTTARMKDRWKILWED